MIIKKRKNQKKNFPNVSMADLHVHTNFSDGKPSAEELVDWVHEKTNLSVIAITDHDEIDGAYEVQKIIREKGYDLEVVIGEEVTAKEGHIIGLFIKKKIPSGLSAKETIKKIHEQGGIAVAAHPFFQTRLRSQYKQVDGVGAITLIKENFDAIEIVNATPFVHVKNGLRAKYINRKLLFKAEIGGSDAHTKEAVGIAYTVFEGKSAKDLRRSIEAGHTQAYRGKMNSQGLLRYLLYCIPKAGQMAYLCLRQGFSPKEPEIIDLPKDFK